MTNFPDHFNELAEAIRQGFTYDFRLLTTGAICCCANWGRIYELHELQTQFICCCELHLTLYLITTDDGIKGTLLDYWEHY